MRPHRCHLLTSALLLLTGGVVLAGDLAPPAGPVGPSMKTLGEVEPRIAVNATNTPGDADSVFRISQPGSYYLTANITGEPAKHGIEIASGGVTLDLNGFDLLGVPLSLSGIHAANVVIKNVAVSNGSVRSWGSAGIDLSVPSLSNARVSTVRAQANAGDGIAVNYSCTVSDCSVFECGGAGIRAILACSITRCVANGNAGGGIAAGADGVVTDCIAGYNVTDGVTCNSGCVIRGNSCNNNGFAGVGAGIRVTGAGNRIEANTCAGGDFGVQALGGFNFIARNICSGNTTNWSIVANNRCLVVNAAGGAAINGDSGGVSPGSTNPNANYTY